MSVVMLPKYLPEGAAENETAEEASARLHIEENRPLGAPKGMRFPPYVYTPYPRAVYRDWDPDDRENEVMRIAGKHMLDLEKRRDRLTADQLVGQYETRNIGVIDFVRHSNNTLDVISELRERNDKEFKAALEEGWAETPSGVKDAKRRMQMRVATLAAERQFDDRHLGEQAARELEAIDDAASDHVVNVEETRRELQDAGKLPKGKK